MRHRTLTTPVGGSRYFGIFAGMAVAAMLVAPRTGASPAAYGGHALRPQSLSAFNDYLRGVAVSPDGGAWAVGTDTSVTKGLIERWNGRSWKRVPSPNPGGDLGLSTLDGVAARSPSSAWAVGKYITSNIFEPMFSQTLIEHWNGTAWEQAASPSPGPADSRLLGVTALSPSSAWAVGSYTDSAGWDQTLIEQWNGKTWKQIPSPNPGGPSRSNVLFGVAAMSASNAFAVGIYFGSRVFVTLIEHWDGRAWKQIPSPNGPSGPYGPASSYLYGVAALSPSAAWAVGTYDSTGFNQTLIERWNGRTWKRIPSPNPGGPSQLNLLTAVAVRSTSSAWAAGHYDQGGPPDRTLTEFWNGRAWKTVASPN
jgi:hypothetical protein